MKNSKELIVKTAKLVREEEQRQSREGLDFNFFSLYDMERCEEKTHEKMLYYILSKIGNRKARKLFMQKLLDRLGLAGAWQDADWEILREHFMAEGRLDLFFCAKRVHRCIVVELKIDAQDGDWQLERYHNYIKRCHYEDYRIVYLTLDGKEPSAQSIGSADTEQMIYVSFTEDIVNWLDDCLTICAEYDIESSLMKQYKILLQKLKGEQGMSEAIRKMIGEDETYLKACLRIEKALIDIKAEILSCFLSEIQKELKKKRIKILWDCIENASEYYSNKKNKYLPEFVAEITEFRTSSYGMVKLGMGIEVEYTLNRKIGFYGGEDMEEIPSNAFAEKQKQRTKKVTDAIQECLHAEVRKNRYNCIWWEWLDDEDGNSYDFKRFSDCCVKLIDPEVRRKEAEKIARNCAADIRSLRKALEIREL